MILIIPFQRLLLDAPDGCAPRHTGIAFSLACHKGNASEEQDEQETGVEGSGTASSGTGNAPTSNTGTQISAAPTVNGNNNTQDTSKNYNLTNGSSVNITDSSGVEDALSSLSQALTGAGQLIQGTGSALVDSNAQAQQEALNAQSAQLQSQQSNWQSWLESIPTWQLIAGGVAALGIIVGLPLFLSRKNK